MKPLALQRKRRPWGPNILVTLDTFTNNIPNWLAVAILVVSIGVCSIWYLWPSPVEFPMDDTYIHLTYARNLVEEGKLIFNDDNETGVGTSSILWVLLLAAGYKIGISLEIMAKFLGISSLVSVALGLYLLLRAFWHPFLAFLGSLLVGLSGNLLWFSLSGMETTLFIAIGVLGLLAYRGERWFWLGIFLGLLTLTRPEGLSLAIAIGVIEILHQKQIRRGIMISGLIYIGLISPWFIYLLWRSGNILPTSAIIKHFTSVLTLQYALQKNSELVWLSHIPGLLYTVLWVGYLLEFTLGGMSLPPPTIMIASRGGNVDYSLSLWSIPAWAMVFILLVAAFRKFHLFRKRRQDLQDNARRPMFAFLVWIILHNLCYIFFLPTPGTSSRYGAVNHILLWLVLLYGVKSLFQHRRLMVGLSVGLIVIASANNVYWNSVYDANLDHMINVRIETAHYIRDRIPIEDVLAASDIGALRYHSDRPIVDLGGLIDPGAYQWFEKGASDQYIINHGVEYMALPGRIGASEEGWLDIADIMGLTDSLLFKMNLIVIYKIDHDRWLQGYLPTTNYQESVVIYQLVSTLR